MLNGFENTSAEGFSFHRSFFQLIRFKRNVHYDATTEVICPPGTTCFQYVGDNTDYNVSTIDGNHGVASIAIANWRFSNLDTRQTPLPGEKIQVWSDIESTQVILIKNYHAPDKPSLNQIFLHPVVEVKFKEPFINLFCSFSDTFLERRTSWLGYMSVNADGQPLGKSVVTMLPVINLPVTNMAALPPLLCFVVEQSKNNKLLKPSITFDQTL